MAINLESIDRVRERAHVSYEEARAALEKCNGDVVEALIYLEKQDKVKGPGHEKESKTKSETESGFWATINRILKAGNETKLVISKGSDVVVNLSLTIVILITIILPPLTLLGLLVALFTNHRIQVEKPGQKDLEINKTLDDLSTAASKVSEQVTDAINKK